MATNTITTKPATKQILNNGVKLSLLSTVFFGGVGAYAVQHAPVTYGESKLVAERVCFLGGTSTTPRKVKAGLLPPTPITVLLLKLEHDLQLTKGGLAQLLGVSRPTLYSWIRGIEPRDSNLHRIQHLAAASAILRDAWRGNELPALWQHQKLPSFGRSFLQGAKAGADMLAMAQEMVSMWRSDEIEAGSISHLF